MKYLKLYDIKLYEGKSDFDQITKMINDSKILLEILWDVAIDDYLKLCDNKSYQPSNLGNKPENKNKDYIEKLTVTDFDIDKEALFITLTYMKFGEETNYYLEIKKENVDLYLSSKKFGI